MKGTTDLSTCMRGRWLSCVTTAVVLLFCACASPPPEAPPRAPVIAVKPKPGASGTPSSAEKPGADADAVSLDLDLVIAWEPPRGWMPDSGATWRPRGPRTGVTADFAGPHIELVSPSFMPDPAEIASLKAKLPAIDWNETAVGVREEQLCWPELRDAVRAAKPERVMLAIRGGLTEKSVACLHALGRTRLYLAGCRYHDFRQYTGCNGDIEVAALAANEDVRQRVYGLAASINKLASLDALESFPNLGHLALTKGPKSEPDVHFDNLPLERLTRLRYLHLGHWYVRPPQQAPSAAVRRVLARLHTLAWFGPDSWGELPNCQLRRVQSSMSDDGAKALSGCHKLTHFDTYLSSQAIAKATVHWPALEVLKIDYYKGKDLAPFSHLSNLRELTLVQAHITDFSALAKLSKLKKLRLDRAKLSDLGVVAKLSNLEALNLSYTAVSDISPLAVITSLRDLNLSGTKVENIKPLSKLTKLQSLDLSFTPVRNVTPLSNHPSLRWLSLFDSKVSDIRPLLTVPKLQRASISQLTIPATQLEQLQKKLRQAR